MIVTSQNGAAITMAVECSPFEPGRDDAEVLELRAAVWGVHHPSNEPAFFRWLFQSNPAGRGTGVMLRRSGKLIGFIGLVARNMSLRGHVVPVAQAIDYMVDPRAGGGLSGMYGYRLLQAWPKPRPRLAIGSELGFPNFSSVRLATSPKLGWERVFSPCPHVATFRATALAKGEHRRRSRAARCSGS